MSYLLTTLKGTAESIYSGDYTDVTTSVNISTQRLDSPGKMVFDVIENQGISIEEGTQVAFTDDGQPVFKGYVFSAKRKHDGKVTYTAYDQLRYLKAKASFAFSDITLEGMIKSIASHFGLKVGALAPTGYVFPTYIAENQTCLDIIFDALSKVTVQTGKIFNFYDYNGELRLTEAKDMFIDTIIGSSSLATGYTYTRDIDSKTYNRIKLVKPNESSGRTDVYLVEDTGTQADWGFVQYCKEVYDSLNPPQIEETATK